MADWSKRAREVWTRRQGAILWTAVAVMAVFLVVLVGARVLSGATNPPQHFAFSFVAPTCGCVKFTQTTHGFPSSATVRFSWWVTWTGNNGSAQLAIAKASGALVYLAVSEYQQGNPYNLNETWGQGGGGTFSGAGSPFTIGVEVVSLTDFLPPDTTIWINGTYTTPLL